jgi:hypothetical protein
MFLLRRNATFTDCPKNGVQGHEQDGECHDTNGVDPTSLPCKRSGDLANKNPRNKNPRNQSGFGQQAWK